MKMRNLNCIEFMVNDNKLIISIDHTSPVIGWRTTLYTNLNDEACAILFKENLEKSIEENLRSLMAVSFCEGWRARERIKKSNGESFKKALDIIFKKLKFGGNE